MVVPNGKISPGFFVLVNVTVPPQLSDVVGAAQLATAWQDALAVTRILEGQPVMTGFVLSWTVTLNEHVEVLPAASVAVYVTVVVPSANTSPGFLVEESVPPPQLSEKVGAVQLTVAWQDALAFIRILEGQPVMTGFVLS